MRTHILHTLPEGEPKGLAGKGCMTLFFGVFLGLGALMTVVVALEAGSVFAEYGWKRTACTIVRSEVSEEPDRPQPYLDREAGNGTAVSVGRIRPCPVLDWKFVLLGHNTLRGAAGGSIHNAELLVQQGWTA